MLQNTNVNVHITSFNNHHIDAQIQSKRGSWMRCTWIYGHPKMAQKKNTQTFLRRLAGLSDTPWLYFSDFNEILYPNEKIEGNDRSVNMISEFKEALHNCNLIDLGCKGYPFTWSYGRFGLDFIKERLDRCLCNKDQRDIYKDCATINLETWTSYHCLFE